MFYYIIFFKESGLVEDIYYPFSMENGCFLDYFETFYNSNDFYWIKVKTEDISKMHEGDMVYTTVYEVSK